MDGRTDPDIAVLAGARRVDSMENARSSFRISEALAPAFRSPIHRHVTSEVVGVLHDGCCRNCHDDSDRPTSRSCAGEGISEKQG